MENLHSKTHVGHKAVLSRNQARPDKTRTMTLRHVNTSSQQKLHIEATDSPKASPRSTRSSEGHGLWTLLFPSLLLASASCRSDSQVCPYVLKTPGRTWPPRDIVLESNQSLKIYCILDDVSLDPRWEALNSSDLVFFRNHELLGPEYTAIVNSTTALLHVENVSPSDDIYYCQVKPNHHSEAKYQAVCLNRVVVGFKPQKPREFKCVSENWKKLNCSWNPEPNQIPTNFSLRYAIPGNTRRQHSFECPETRSDLFLNSCEWTLDSEPPYLKDEVNLTFELNITNVLGNRIFKYDFDHFANESCHITKVSVIPSKPEGLIEANNTYSSVLLSWYVPFHLRRFPPAFNHRIHYRSHYDPKDDWVTVYLNKTNPEEDVYYNLTNLQYANANYDIRVFIKSSAANGEDKWSEFSEITVKTASTVPGLPPKTDFGSFEIIDNIDNRDVYVYWQPIPQEFENGANVSYRVNRVEENGRNVDIQPSEQTEFFAKFAGISFEEYEFEIVTVNSNGINNQPAVVHVPRRMDVLPASTNFTVNSAKNGLYELSWISINDSTVRDYTIFHCETDRDRPYQCTGYLYWNNVPSYRNSFRIRVPDASEVYRFAISANTADSSSGMKWADCTVLKRDHYDVGQITSVSSDPTTSDKIRVAWTLKCSHQIETIVGFVIHHCPIVSLDPLNATCKHPMIITKVKGDRDTTNDEIVGLQPHTTYMLTVIALTEHGNGGRSDPIYNTTLEAPPSPPQGVSVVNETNTTITIEWQPPAVTNGVIRYYTVFCNEDSTIIEKGTKLEIPDLQPHTSYEISVSATTIGESRRSMTVGRTLIGVPGKIDRSFFHFTKSNRVKISWRPPSNPGGNLDYYEISTHGEVIQTRITELETELAVDDCADQDREPQIYQFQVRAVNMDNSRNRFDGPWSPLMEGTCYNSSAVSRSGCAAEYQRMILDEESPETKGLSLVELQRVLLNEQLEFLRLERAQLTQKR